MTATPKAQTPSCPMICFSVKAAFIFPRAELGIVLDDAFFYFHPQIPVPSCWLSSKTFLQCVHMTLPFLLPSHLAQTTAEAGLPSQILSSLHHFPCASYPLIRKVTKTHSNRNDYNLCSENGQCIPFDYFQCVHDYGFEAIV